MGEVGRARSRGRSGAGRGHGRWLRPIAWGLSLSGLVYVTILGSLWFHVLTTSLAARWLRIHVFHVIFVGYAASLAIVPVGLIASAAIAIRARRARERRPATRAGRAVLVCLGLLVGIGLCEAVCAWQLRNLGRLAHLPALNPRLEPPQADARPLRQAQGARPADGIIDVVTIGESSAKGIPFYPRLSLDRIITWQLGRAFPDKTFRGDNRAEQGITLQKAIERLEGLTRRPDLLIVYSGHNEFQSRFGWGRKAPHYRIESNLGPATLAGRIRGWSSAAEFFGRNADRFEIAVAPPPRHVRDPADSPCCTPAEYATVLEDYRRRLDGLLADCQAAGILTIVVVSPSNLGAFDPNRSILSRDTLLAGQRDFAARLAAVLRDESTDPGRAMAGYRRLIAEQPGFAEAHYRLARLLEAAGSYDEARREYTLASDLDGCPFRCQTPFLDICREVGRRHGSIVVDAPRLLELASPHGIVNDRFFVDAHHPALNTLTIIARDAIRRLKGRKAFGWPDAVPAPEFSQADCIAHFRLDAAAWIEVCKNAWKFYSVTIPLPRDSTWRKSVEARYARAIELLQDGKGPDETGLPALMTREELRADSPADEGP